MSSRQEEKEQRRKEREAAEAAAAAKAARKQRLQLGLGALLTVAAIAVAVLVFSGGEDTEFDSNTTAAATKVAIPALKEADLDRSLKAASCVQQSPAIEGRDHTTEAVTYKNSNPPASGPHYPVAPSDGLYEAGNEPPKEHWVHSLEHGRVIIQYKPGTPQQVIDQLETVGSEEMNGTEAYHVLVMQNNTEMEGEVAVVGWGQVATCAKMSDGFFDVVRNFRKKYTDTGPELIP